MALFECIFWFFVWPVPVLYLLLAGRAHPFFVEAIPLLGLLVWLVFLVTFAAWLMK